MTAAGSRVAVIGRRGQLAMALGRALPAFGLEVVTLARPELDLLAPDEIGRAISGARPQIVVNAAAYTAVDRAEDERDLAFAVNATAAGVIARAAAGIGAAIVHVSTDYVFDGTKRTPYVEGDAVAPLGAYGASKLAGEMAVREANPHHVILRTAWIASPWGHNFVRTMLRLGAERSEIRVIDDQHGRPSFAGDLANGVGRIARSLLDPQERAAAASRFGVFHIANAGATTWCGLARAVMAGAARRGQPAATVVPITTAEYPTRARRPAYSVLATGKIAEVYGIRLPSWEVSLEACLDELLGPAAPVAG